MRPNDNLTFWMVLLGVVAALLSGAEILQRWSYLVPGARLADALILASGMLLLASGAWRGFGRSGARAATWLAAGSAGLFAVTMCAGILLGTIPCSSVG